MAETRYTSEHEWIRIDGDIATIGISQYAQEQLGDVVYVELPETGRKVEAGDIMAVVESVKAASDIYAPVTGEVVGANAVLEDSPELVNSDPYGEGWLFRMIPSDPSQIEGLMDAETYAGQLED